MSATTPLLPALLMIASGSIHAIVNAIMKGAGDVDRFARTAVMSIASALIALPLTLLVPLPHGAWGWLALATCIHAGYFFMLISTLNRADLSAAYPVYRGTAPLMTAAIAILVLGAPITLAAAGGIALIAAGMFLMLAERHLDRVTLGWSVGTALFITAYTLVDAQGVRATPDPVSFILWLFVAMGVSSAIILPRFAGIPIAEAARRDWKHAIAAGALSLVTYGLALYALSLGPTAQLAALRETGMVTALLIGMLVLKERVTRGRVAAILSICAGAALIIAA